MPRNTTQTPPTTTVAAIPPAPSSLALVAEQMGLSEADYRALMSQQAESLPDDTTLPRLKVMPQGVGLFEFGDTNDTVNAVDMIVLHSHARHTLWDKPFGSGSPDEPQFPACASPDGINGIVRAGFEHAALDGHVPAEGEVVTAQCGLCPYNEWESMTLIGKTGKGKACTTQRSVYGLVAGREVPVELTLSPTSVGAWDEYLTTLMSRGMPVQAVFTRASLERKERGSLRWSVVRFAQGEQLLPAQLTDVLAKRTVFANAMNLTIGVATPRARATSTVTDEPPF